MKTEIYVFNQQVNTVCGKRFMDLSQIYYRKFVSFIKIFIESAR
jgi:hypothetical protein